MTRLTDEEFLELWKEHKSVTAISKVTGYAIRSLNRKRRKIEETKNTVLVAQNSFVGREHPSRKILGIENGTVIVFSDAHFWPGIHTTAYHGLIWAIKEFAPKAVIANGDVFDGAGISRHPRIGWDSTPSVIQELKACEIALGEIEETAKAARHNVRLIWPLGNHDARFENMLAAHAPQYEHVKGFSLKDHFPAWEPCWSAWPTDNICVKHRWKGGIHATHNNALASGVSMVTGHLHSLKVTPYSDYNGTRYGVDTGTLAEPSGPQFSNYTEDSPLNWRSGFAVLTIHNGQLLVPELVQVWNNDSVQFRGQIVKVKNDKL